MPSFAPINMGTHAIQTLCCAPTFIWLSHYKMWEKIPDLIKCIFHSAVWSYCSYFIPNRMIHLINDQNWNELVVQLKKRIIHYNEHQADWDVNIHMILALIICSIQHNDACNNKCIQRIHIINKHLYMEQIIHQRINNHPIYIHMKMIQNIIRYVHVRESSVLDVKIK